MHHTRAGYLFSLMVLMVTLTISCSPSGSGGKETPDSASGAYDSDERESVVSDDPFSNETRDYLLRLEKLGFAGIARVARDGNLFFSENYGLADREAGRKWSSDTISTIGSITKQFTGAAILLLEEKGRLRVEDPITKYFDPVPPDKQSITLHHLLTHSSGIVDLEGLGDWDPITREEFIRRAMDQPLDFEPGEDYRYSNAGYSLLGAIIEQLTGGSYEQFVRENLLIPQGLKETGYILADWEDERMAIGYEGDERWGTILGRPLAEDGPFWALRANGGIHSTGGDMLRWATALAEGKVLSPASMAKYWAPHVDEGGGDSHYGYGWVVTSLDGGRKMITHNGGNGIFFADLTIFPDENLVMFTQTNIAANLPLVEGLLEGMALRLFEDEPYSTVPDRVEVSGEALAPLAGRYHMENDQGIFEVTADGSELIVEADDPVAFAGLHSTRELDLDRLGRFTRRLDEIIGAYVTENFQPLYDAYEGRAPIERLRDGWKKRRAELEEEHGHFQRHEVLGSALRDGRDVTLVRFLFERGHVDRLYVWEMEEEEKLLGFSRRGLDPALRFVPTGKDAFGSWDGGISSSRELRFETDESGKRLLRLGPQGASIEARRPS